MKQYIKNRFRERKRQIGLMSFLTVFVVSVTFLGLAIPKIMAGDTQVSDLLLQGESKEQSIALTLKDEHPEDTKIVIPLPEGVTYTSNSNSNIGVTYDELNKQLVIDWVEGEEKQLELQLEVEQEGQYDFTARTVRDGEPVTSLPCSVVVNILEEGNIIENDSNEKEESLQKEEQSEESNDVAPKQTVEENESEESRVVSSENTVAQGKLGTAPWVLDDAGVVHLGSGTLPTVTSSQQDEKLTWRTQADKILKISIEGKVVVPETVSSLFSGLPKLQEVVGFGNIDARKLRYTTEWFKNATEITHLDMSEFDAPILMNANNMFAGMSKLVSLDVSTWDTSKLANTQSMFEGCSSLNELDISQWSTPVLTYNGAMFKNMSSLQKLDLTNFTSKGGGLVSAMN